MEVRVLFSAPIFTTDYEEFLQAGLPAWLALTFLTGTQLAIFSSDGDVTAAVISSEKEQTTMPNNNKKTRGSQQSNISQQSNPGVGHGSTSGSEDRSNTGNSDRNQGMGNHGSSRRNENIESGNRSNDR